MYQRVSYGTVDDKRRTGWVAEKWFGFGAQRDAYTSSQWSRGSQNWADPDHGLHSTLCQSMMMMVSVMMLMMTMAMVTMMMMTVLVTPTMVNPIQLRPTARISQPPIFPSRSWGGVRCLLKHPFFHPTFDLLGIYLIIISYHILAAIYVYSITLLLRLLCSKYWLQMLNVQ